jgi:hypothetical protein
VEKRFLMAIRTSLRFLAVLLLIAVASADPASADPVLVNAGSFSVHSGDNSLFRFIGNGFEFPAEAQLFDSLTGPLRTCVSCDGGTPVDLSSHLSGIIGEWVNRPDLPVRFNGNTYATVFYSGDLAFDAPTVVAPDPSQTPFFTFNEGFTFSGQITGFPTIARNTAPLFSTALTGNGTVQFRIFAVDRTFFFGDLDYNFAAENPSPTPEPATIFLVGTAVAGAFTRRLRRR